MRIVSLCIRIWMGLALMGAWTIAFAQPPFSEGKDYVVFSSPKSVTDAPKGQIAVVEWMWHGCPHCYQFEPHLRRWLEKEAPDRVHFVRKPAVPRQEWVPTALVYGFAEQQGVARAIHQALFQGIHEQGKAPGDLTWMVSLFRRHNLEQDFRNFLNDKTAAQEYLAQLQKQQGRQGVTAVPSVIVDSRYKVTRELAQSYERMMKIVDYLVEQRLQAQGR